MCVGAASAGALGCPAGVAAGLEPGLGNEPEDVGVRRATGQVGVAAGATGVRGEIGPTPNEGELTAVGTPSVSGGKPLPSLTGTIIATVSNRPQQKARSEPPTIPPIVAASLDLDPMLYLRSPTAKTTAVPTIARTTTAMITHTKTSEKPIGVRPAC